MGLELELLRIGTSQVGVLRTRTTRLLFIPCLPNIMTYFILGGELLGHTGRDLIEGAKGISRRVKQKRQGDDNRRIIWV